MKALLILAHGSRKKESNEEIIHLAEALDALPQTGWSRVLCAFNQFSEPAPDDQIKALADQGVTDITVLPYFIAAGSHVLSDIPEIVDRARGIYPGIRFHLTPHLGAFKGIKGLIIKELSSD